MTDTQKIFIKLFKKSACNIAVTCKKVNIDRKTFYNWYNKTIIENDKNGNDVEVENDFKTAVDEAKESIIDYTESALFKKISGITTKTSKVKEVLTKNGDIVRLREEQTITNQPDIAAIIFLLKTLGRKRGWKEVSDMKVDNEPEGTLSNDQKAAIKKLSTEDKKKLLEISKKFLDV